MDAAKKLVGVAKIAYYIFFSQQLGAKVSRMGVLIGLIANHLRKIHNMKIQRQQMEIQRQQMEIQQRHDEFMKAVNDYALEQRDFETYLEELHMIIHTNMEVDFTLDIDIESITDAATAQQTTELKTQPEGSPGTNIEDAKKLDEFKKIRVLLNHTPATLGIEPGKLINTDYNEDLRTAIYAIFLAKQIMVGEKAARDYEKQIDVNNDLPPMLFLVELMCKDNIDISFKLNATEQDIRREINKCTRVSPDNDPNAIAALPDVDEAAPLTRRYGRPGKPSKDFYYIPTRKSYYPKHKTKDTRKFKAKLRELDSQIKTMRELIQRLERNKEDATAERNMLQHLKDIKSKIPKNVISEGHFKKISAATKIAAAARGRLTRKRMPKYQEAYLQNIDNLERRAEEEVSNTKKTTEQKKRQIELVQKGEERKQQIKAFLDRTRKQRDADINAARGIPTKPQYSISMQAPMSMQEPMSAASSHGETHMSMSSHGETHMPMSSREWHSDDSR